jgi:hypothetical protein
MSTRFAPTGTEGVPSQIRYVLVNHRIPRADPHCALCGQGLQSGYVRNLQTGQLYCDQYCQAGHTKLRARAIEYLAQVAS